jgi:hypothetical protein
VAHCGAKSGGRRGTQPPGKGSSNVPSAPVRVIRSISRRPTRRARPASGRSPARDDAAHGPGGPQDQGGRRAGVRDGPRRVRSPRRPPRPHRRWPQGGTSRRRVSWRSRSPRGVRPCGLRAAWCARPARARRRVPSPRARARRSRRARGPVRDARGRRRARQREAGEHQREDMAAPVSLVGTSPIISRPHSFRRVIAPGPRHAPQFIAPAGRSAILRRSAEKVALGRSEGGSRRHCQARPQKGFVSIDWTGSVRRRVEPGGA